MSPVVARAIAIRTTPLFLTSAAIIVVVAVGGAHQSVPMVAVSLMVICFCAWIASSLIGDRKLELCSGARDQPWEPGDRFSYSITVACQTSGTAGMTRAAKALNEAGAFDVKAIDNSTVVGWAAISFPLVADYQLEIVVRENMDGTCEFICRSRPRWKYFSLSGLEKYVNPSRRARKFAEDLQSKIQSTIKIP